ncbi:MAG: hypothetical protein ACEQSE_07000 [Candidatus Aquirickettsiella gammari]
MNRYPLWKYIIILIALVFGALYTAPNFFGDSPAVQINSAKATVKVDDTMIARVEQLLKEAGISSTGFSYDYNGIQGSIRARFVNTDVQFKAKAVLEKGLNVDPTDPVYTVALNLLPNTPEWMQKLRAFPMYLGLDLRGGVHFSCQMCLCAFRTWTAWAWTFKPCLQRRFSTTTLLRLPSVLSWRAM